MHWIDPDSLSSVKSKVARFLFNAKGDADGMLLADGTEAHFPPHLSEKVLKSIRPGDAVTLYGVKPRAADMIACIAIQGSHGTRIDDTGSPAKAKKKVHAKKHHGAPDASLTRVEIEGTIERQLHGPKCEVRGVLLATGRIVRFPPHASAKAQKLLKVGAKLAVRGEALTVSHTVVIEARAWGKSRSHMKPLTTKPHPK